ncbi:MAG: DUF4065 domain-containing protein [Dehalococcoidia bacterium]|nr:DUF4065 domain-containing protein [Dehalococcoidia bacterium]
MAQYQYARLRATLLALLHALGKKARRTKIVNLVYLIDAGNYRMRGETITGLEYIRERGGPNAVGNSIVRMLDRLVKDSELTEEICVQTDVGVHRYRTSRNLDVSTLPLSGDDWIEIQTSIHKYGRMNTEEIVRESRNTIPVQNAREYETLQLCQDQSLHITDGDIANDPLLRIAIQAKTADAGGRITLDDLRGHIGEPA